MKNKILLTLVLLIPSLCFGKSLRFIYFPTKDTLYIDFLCSTNAPKGRLDFPILADEKLILMSEKSLRMFKSMLSFHFSLESIDKTFKKYFVTSEKPVMIPLLSNVFLEMAVLNNYQVTFTDQTKHTFDVYLYKPDK